MTEPTTTTPTKMSEADRRKIIASTIEQQVKAALRAASRKAGDEGITLEDLAKIGVEVAEETARSLGAADLLPITIKVISTATPANPSRVAIEFSGAPFVDPA